MIQWLVHIIIDALVLFGAAKMMKSVHMKDLKTSFLIALFIGVVSFLIGWLLTLILNIATLGLFYFLGLGFIIRIIANGLIIELADKISSGFDTKGIWPSFVLAIIIALVATLVDWALFSATT